MIATSHNDMLRALLMDDDPESLQVISSIIELFCPYVTIIGKYTDPAEGKADGYFCDFHIEERTSMTICEHIYVYGGRLNKYGFMRVHRDHVVNLLHVREYYDYDGNWVVMSDGCRVPVSGD